MPQKDFDYVSFADYSADMKETADNAAAIISQLNRSKRELEELVWRLVWSAGGRIEVSRNIQNAQSGTLTTEREMSRDVLIFSAR